MKKILIIGQFNEVMESLNKHISTKFTTQMCMANLDMVKAMKKVFKQDLILISLVGIEEFDTAILDFLREKSSAIPIMFLGTAEECRVYQNKYSDSQYEYVVRPTTLGMLLQRCELVLKMIGNNGEAATSEEVMVDDSQPKKCVMAVDDSGIFLRSIKAMLDKQYDVVVANAGATALNMARKKKPDLILLDYEMPGWDGKKTFEEIKEDDELKDIPVVFLTAVSDRKHIAGVLSLKPAGYLLKPVEQQRLIDTIKEVMIEI